MDSELLQVFALYRRSSPSTESSYRAFLRFICSNDGLDGEEDIPVLDVAKLLAKHGVRYVIMNACESASEEGSMSSAARTMIQEGLLLAIGMRYQILDSAIDIFVRNFYSQYVNHGTTFISAAHISRLALQKQPNRRTKFNTDVQVTDYITPIVAVSTEMELCDLRLDHEVSTLALVDEKKVEICGREVDILDLESKTSISNVLPIIASAGTGKTFLARHLCWWWKATGYVEDFVQIDCGMLGGLEFHHIREKIDAALDLASTHGSKDAVTYLNEHKYLIVIDSLDAVQINQESSSSQRALRRFLRKIEPSIVLLLSRFEEQWMKAASEVTYYLNPLDMKASLHLATQEATKMSCDIQTGDRLDLRFLEQCISLVDGNALAISILIRAYKVSCNSFKLLYRKLTDGSVLNGYGEDDCEEDRHRGYVDAHDLVRQQIGTSRVAHIGDDDLRILTPFWKSLPANLANYRIFIQLAKARVAGDGETPVLPKFWLKAGIEGFPTEEFDVAVRGKEFPAIKVSSLRSLEPAFQLCEERGFLFRKSSINANGNDRSVLIHPLMTLVLRSQPFALPKWAAHIVRVAFHRFVSYQTRHWPEGMTAIADPNVQRKLDAAFADYATACSFSLTIKPGYLNCFVLDIIDWSIYHIQRRAPVVLDICDRFLAVFAIPLARNRASLAQNIFFFAYKIYRRIKKIRKIDRGDYTTDARGLLEGRCLNAIHFADVAAKILDVEHDQSELLERIAKNLQNHSGCYKVNLTLLAGARTSLAHHKIGDQDQTSALKDIFKLDQAHFEEYNRNGIGVQSGLVNFDLGRKVAAVEAPEEIDALEQEFRELLNRQLDGIDAAGGKAVIYETLAVLALKRERYEDAFRHIDTATQLFRPFQHGKPQQWKNLLDEREKILEMRTIRGPHSSEAFRVRSPDDDPVRSITTALQRLQDTRVIGSYKVTAAGQEQGHG